MIQKIVVLGSGSAGLLAALTLKRKLPSVAVRIVRDPALGIIGVGEGIDDLEPFAASDFARALVGSS